MKQVFILCTLFVFAITAQAQQIAVVTVKISIPTIQGQPCKERLEQFLKYEEGVAKATIDIRKKIITISYHTERTTIENLKTQIANQGFDADDIKANPDSYKRLPTDCKKPEDRPGYDPNKPKKKN